MSAGGPDPEEPWRRLAPQVLAALTRRHGDFADAEDAVQEALLAAATQWPVQGRPDDPRAWLVTVASRRLVDRWRSDEARRRREEQDASRTPGDRLVAQPSDADAAADDTLELLLLCCHPALAAASQVALTLRAVAGLTTAEIARAFVVPEPTMAQRISRAKRTIRDTGAQFGLPTPADLPQRLGSVLHVLYLVFDEGYTATSGPSLYRVDLSTEAIRLARQVHHLRPGDGEVAGLLALMLLTDARRATRTTPDGRLVPLARQDRTRWDAALIEEGIGLVTAALRSTELGPYQVQAAIAAVHAEAATAEETDWPQVVGLYRVLGRLAPGPVVTMNAAVAVAMAEGARAGLLELAQLDGDRSLARRHRVHAVRAHLLELDGRPAEAVQSYRTAARLSTSHPEQAYLHEQVARLEQVPVQVQVAGGTSARIPAGTVGRTQEDDDDRA